jgi:transposase
MALSIDIRQRVVAAYKANEGGYITLSKRFRVGECSVKRWVALEQETGDVKRRPRGGGNPAKIATESLSKLAELVKEKPDRTNQELADEWNRREGTGLSRSAMVRALKRAGLSLKKSPSRVRKASG